MRQLTHHISIQAKGRRIYDITPQVLDWANKSGLQSGTVRNIVMAWVLTLPITIVLSAALFWLAITVIV